VIRLYSFPEDVNLEHLQNYLIRRSVDWKFYTLEDPANVRFLYERGHTSAPQAFDDDGNEVVHIGNYEAVQQYVEEKIF
jgi:hypothetical protein